MAIAVGMKCMVDGITRVNPGEQCRTRSGKRQSGMTTKWDGEMGWRSGWRSGMVKWDDEVD
jgi:hypothetical protein